jgi:putative ABC transport system permease protein
MGNFKNYFLYFITMIISIVMYYTFVSLQNSSEIQEILEYSSAMKSTFLLSSIILILFVGIFILYSNSFFTRKRKKEVGLYAIVGVPKKTIGKMLFYENLIMGAIALIISIFLGTLLSKLFSMILIKLIGVPVTVGLDISTTAVLSTIAVFAVIILFTSIQGYRLIYKFKLIELFRADNKGEHSPKASVIVAFLAIIILLGSYFLADQVMPRGNSNILRHTLLIISGIIIGTYLFFHSSIAFILMLVKRNKSFYYRGTNMIGISQLLYRIKGNTRTFTMIALLSAVTISFFGAVFTQYNNFESSSLNFAPFSYTHLSKGTEFDEKVHQIISEDSKHPLIGQINIPVIEANVDFTAPGSYRVEPTKVISVSTYLSVSNILYKDLTLDVADGEAVAIRPTFTNHNPSDYKDKKITVRNPSGNQTLSFTGMVEDRVLTWAYPDFFIIVSDQTFQKLSTEITPLVYKAYEVEDERNTKATTSKLMSLNDGETNVFGSDKDNTQIFSYYLVYQENLEKSALNMFVVGFLGLIFLAATGSIIYFKQLTEATESKAGYDILRKIGVTTQEILFSVAKQNLFIFILPLILGIVNSVILLSFLSKFLSELIGLDIGGMLVISSSVFITIYLGYYFLTVNTYNQIVNDFI